MFVSVSYLINMNSFLPAYPLRPHPLYSSMALIHSHSLQCNLTENAETMRKKLKVKGAVMRHHLNVDF